jgi:NADPH:quinone reductase-like Zn-dependent oxidoreductase
MPRVVRFYEHGDPNVLRIDEIQIPLPSAGEVQIHVQALGLNRAEALLRAGTYIETPSLPSGLGLEAAGIIGSVGAGVSGFREGEAVSIVPPVSMVQWPAYGEVINVPAERAVRMPGTFSAVQSASVWMPYLTAYGALIDIAELRHGDFVVITAASSSVGLAAIQLANRIGATSIAITRTSAKKRALLDAGAAHVVAFSEEDLASRLAKITGAEGARVVLDPIGGPIFEPLTQAMSRGGVLIEYGGLSRDPTPFPLFAVLSKTLTIRGYLVHELLTNPDRLRAAMEFILEGLGSGALRPIIAKTFPLEEIVAAHRYLETNEQFGKIVVTI